MTSLSLVTHRLACGVWRHDDLPADQLAALAAGLGWSVRRGTISSSDDKAAYLTELGSAAGVPAYVRANWDSMADGLRDLDPAPHTMVLLESPHTSPFDALAVEILNEAVAFWTRQGVALQVVWYGPIDAPSLDDVEPPRRSRAR